MTLRCGHEQADEILAALVATDVWDLHPTIVAKKVCCLCHRFARRVDLNRAAAHGGGTGTRNFHEPTCPWRQAAEYLKERRR